MNQDGEIRSGESVRDEYEFAWSGKRYCDLSMNESDLALIEDDLANGANKDDFIAITAHIVHQTSGLIMLSEDLPVEKPLSWEDATDTVKAWFIRKTDELGSTGAMESIVIELKEEDRCRE